MSKLLFFSLFLCLFVLKGNNKTKYVYNERIETVNGKPERLIITGIDLRGSPFLMRYNDTIYFNRKGTNVETREGWSDGLRITDKNGQQYRNGKLIDTTFIKTICTYDKQGNTQQESLFNENGMYEKNVYYYNGIGNLVNRKTYDKSNSFSYEINYLYNDNNDLIEEDYLTGSVENNSKTFFEIKSYDKKGNWLMEVETMRSYNQSSPFFTDTLLRSITYY